MTALQAAHDVSDEELPQYVEVLTKIFYPRSILFSNTAKLKMRHKVDASIMVDEWPMINCTLIRLPHCEVEGNVAFLLAKSQEKLEKFLAELNYSGDTLIVSEDETSGHLRCMVKSWPFGLEEITLLTVKAYHYPGKRENLPQWSCHEGTYVAKLRPEHAGFISNYRVYGEPKARTEMLEYVIENCYAMGVFLKSDPSHPVSWSLLSYYGHILHVFTLEQYRGKGYGRMVVLSLMEQLLESGLTPALEIVEGNVVSTKLFTGLGFVESYNSTWKKFIPLKT